MNAAGRAVGWLLLIACPTGASGWTARHHMPMSVIGAAITVEARLTGPLAIALFGDSFSVWSARSDTRCASREMSCQGPETSPLQGFAREFSVLSRVWSG
jgi:hypothetical protein